MFFWDVHDYAYPLVSIIVTCGPGHKHYLIDALDSIQAQTYPDWECVVVNDTGAKWPKNIAGAPWARVVSTDGNKGAAAARNAGYQHTKGRYVVWLDADDYWMPWYLEKMVAMAEENFGASRARNEGYKHIKGQYVVWLDADDYWMPWYLEKMVGMAQENDGLIFSDLLTHDFPNIYKPYHYEEFDCSKVAVSFRYPGTSVLIPRRITEAVREKQGGWDEETPGMEDWDYAVAIHDLGFCAYHIPEPLFVYRIYSSTKREIDYNKRDAIRDYMDKKWHKYRKDGVAMACGCSSSKKTPRVVKALTSSGNFSDNGSTNLQTIQTDEGQMIMLEYVGPVEEPFTIRSRAVSGITYRFANNPLHKRKAVFLHDAEYLTSILGPDDKPMYIIATAGATLNAGDPSAFLGVPIQAA